MSYRWQWKAQINPLQELINVSHTTTLMLRQMFAQAETILFDLHIDTTNLENEYTNVLLSDLKASAKRNCSLWGSKHTERKRPQEGPGTCIQTIWYCIETQRSDAVRTKQELQRSILEDSTTVHRTSQGQEQTSRRSWQSQGWIGQTGCEAGIV